MAETAFSDGFREVEKPSERMKFFNLVRRVDQTTKTSLRLEALVHASPSTDSDKV